MSDLEVRLDERVIEPPDGWSVTVVDPVHGVVRLSDGARSLLAVAQGRGSDWVVTLRGRRIALTVRTWRERLLAEAETSARAHAGPTIVKATLPGLVVAVAVAVGDEVADGAPLLTIEAMKMQNEVRAPRSGRVVEVSVSVGQTVATGLALLRLE